jgi:hypothetical protein
MVFQLPFNQVPVVCLYDLRFHFCYCLTLYANNASLGLE